MEEEHQEKKFKEISRPEMLHNRSLEAWQKIGVNVLMHTDYAKDVMDVIRPVIECEKWCNWTASAGMHHHREGGLVEHTCEVLILALDIAKSLQGMGARIDIEALLVAAVWHDYRKIDEYTMRREGKDNEFRVDHREYHKLVHHITGSTTDFCCHFRKLCEEREYKLLGFNHPKPLLKFEERVSHIMLAHHGRLEWHSPVEPRTIEAHILHAADSLSASYDALQSTINEPKIKRERR